MVTTLLRWQLQRRGSTPNWHDSSSAIVTDGLNPLSLAQAVLATYLYTVGKDDPEEYRVVVRKGLEPPAAIVGQDDLEQFLERQGYYRHAQRAPLREVLDPAVFSALPYYMQRQLDRTDGAGPRDADFY
ncbi:hypothetical protein ACFYS8_36300 [Kitasatospora sp. NPDC004615]|uniref:hypothetical protein n=1 Tax=Kitasatospora sp. NPDC004615 TaxID=3364017 RepID=UPI0036C01857